MASKSIVFCAILAVARAGNLLAPAAPIAAYSAAPAVSHVYSSISGAPYAASYPALHAVHAAPAVHAVHTAPALHTVHAAPALHTVHAAPAIHTVHAAPALQAVHTAPALHAAPVIAKYSPSTAVSTSYTSFGAPAQYVAAPVAKTLTYAAAAPSVAIHTPAIGSSSQNIIRSFDGTVSQYSKAVDTAFSSVRKYDTRVNNNVYTPALAKTIAYAAPAQTYVASHAPTYVASHGPAVIAARTSLYSAPAAIAAPTAYATKAVAYSPASSVAHVSFQGYGAQYGW